MTIGAFRLNSLSTISDSSIILGTPGDGTSPGSASAPSFTFGTGSTFSTALNDIFDTSVVYSNADTSTGAYAVSYGTSSGQIAQNIRHTTRTLTLGTAVTTDGTASPVKRSYGHWGMRTGGNFNKRGFAQSHNSSSSRTRAYTLISSTGASQTSGGTLSTQLLGEMPVTSTGWHEWILSGSTLSVNRYGGSDSTTWHNTATTYSSSIAVLPSYDFYDCLKTSPVNAVSFWYGASATSGYKDVLIIYSESSNTHIIDTTNTFNYNNISTSVSKKGIVLSANINQTSGINCIGYWDTSTAKLDLKLFTVGISPSLSATFGNKYTLNMSGETNVKLMTSHLGCDFCYLISTNSSGSTTYIRKVTASGVNGLTISNPVSYSTSSGTTEVAIGNTATDGLLVSRNGTTGTVVAFTN